MLNIPRYLLLRFRLAELLFRESGGNRRDALYQSQSQLETFIKLLDGYTILSKQDVKLYEAYVEDPSSFATASTTNAAARRQTKILRFKEEKELKGKIEVYMFSGLGKQRLIKAESTTRSNSSPKRRCNFERTSPH